MNRNANKQQVMLQARAQRYAKAAADQPWRKCAYCGKEHFMKASRLKVIPAVAVAESHDVVWDQPVLICTSCGYEFNPNEIAGGGA